MQVFKFGGASVKDVEGVKNVVHVLEKHGVRNKVVVVSAMGKMTNALEEVVGSYFEDQNALSENIKYIKNFHLEIADKLFEQAHPVHQKVENFIADLKILLERNKSGNYDYVYDQVIAYGELLSTTIISDYLLTREIDNIWVDTRKLIKTDATFRDAKVDWEATARNIKQHIHTSGLTVTQGFIASDKENSFTTTLGREGSDYTAGIYAYCLEAESVSIWKNVQGVLNADPREFSNTTLLEHISYEETIELAFYGASVIHPKTIQPLQRKGISLYVKCFLRPEEKGTTVGEGPEIFPKTPCFIIKKNLILISLSTSDFSFFVEENISEVFALFHKYQVKVHLIQNSAISFSVCVDNKFNKAAKLIEYLRQKFEVNYHKDVDLFTVRHFDEQTLQGIRSGKEILLQQRTQNTVQLVTKG